MMVTVRSIHVGSYRGDCTKGKIKHGKGSVFLVNSEPMPSCQTNRMSQKKGGSQHPDFSETSCNQILARFPLVTSPKKGLNVLKIPFRAVTHKSA